MDRVLKTIRLETLASGAGPRPSSARLVEDGAAWLVWGALVASLLCIVAASGCRSKPYEYGKFSTADASTLPTIFVEYGEPRPRIERLKRFVRWPERVFRLESKKRNDEPSPETIEKLKEYMARNDLGDVYVYVNSYEPREQWRRLRDNRHIGAGWRYTFGAASVVAYTLMPGPLFGTDRYNPYTNCLNLNSDLPAVALHEAAFAKNVHQRRLPGTYVALTAVPGASLYRLSHDAQEVIAYAQAHGDWDVEREVYKVIYPRIGAEGVGSVGGVVIPDWWAGPVLSLSGSIVGHAVGHAVAKRRQQALNERRAEALAQAREDETVASLRRSLADDPPPLQPPEPLGPLASDAPPVDLDELWGRPGVTGLTGR